MPAELLTQVTQRKRAGGERAPESRDAAQIGKRGSHDIHAAVRIVDPVDRHLGDPQSAALGQHEQLGVEEPVVVVDVRQQRAGAYGAHGLEAALRVGESSTQRCAQQDVVAAGDHLAPRATHDTGRARQPAADRDVAVSRHERCDERQQRGQISGQVDVHIRDDRSRTCRPHRVQRSAAALCVEVHDADIGQFGGESVGAKQCCVGACVVGDRDLRAEREVAQVVVQAAHARHQVFLLVVHGNDDLDVKGARLRRSRYVAQRVHRIPPIDL